MSIWPIHPPPEHDELLSSWMVRLAHANCYKVHDFYCHCFGRERQVWTRDIDGLEPDWLLAGLSEHTGVSQTSIHQLSLRSFEGVVFERFIDRSVNRGILPIGIYHRTHRVFGQQFCPMCLLEDDRPYLRRAWRVAFVTVCVKHQILLHDRCEHCSKPMMPHRADMGSKYGFPKNIGIDFCGCCGKRFTTKNLTVAEKEMLAFQRQIDECISSGFMSLGSEELYSFLFFDGLRTMAHGIGRMEHIKDRFGLEYKVVLELSDIAIRYELLRSCAKLLMDWPNKFITYLAAHRRPYSTFVSKNTHGVAPCWIDKTIKINF